MDKTQTVDEKYGVICLVIMFTLRVSVFKMSEIVVFKCIFVFFCNLSQFGQYIYVHMEDLIEFLQKMIWLIGYGLNCLWDIVDKYQKNCWVNKKIAKSCIFKCWYFATGSSELHNP